MRRWILVSMPLLLLALIPASPRAEAAVAPPGFTDEVVAQVDAPVGMDWLPAGGWMLVATQRGLVQHVEDGAVTTLLDLGPKICTNVERGIAGIATDPDPASRAFYLYYTAKGSDPSCPTTAGEPNPPGAPRNRVSRFVLRADGTVDPASETVLLDGIYSPAGYHNAGDLHVGKDGYLYVTTGDGGCDYRGDSGCGGANDASRDRNVLNGKVLRITRTGGIPPENPFHGSGTARCQFAPAPAGTTCQEAFAVGFRNPFRFAFDPDAAGTSFRVNDVGQNVWEEIDQVSKGADYGWPIREGHCAQTGSETDCGAPLSAGLTNPIYDYPHSTGCGSSSGGSITGGAYVPRGVWPAEYDGSYLFADYVCGTIFRLSPSLTRTGLVTGLGASSAVDLAFSRYTPQRGLYYTSYAKGGEVHRIDYTGSANRTPSAALAAQPSSGAAPLATALSGAGSTDPDGDPLTYLWSFGDGSPAATTTTAAIGHTYAAGTWTATVRVRDAGGLVSAPATVTIRSGDDAPRATITGPAAGTLFTVGGSYRLSGSATDAQDGTLPAASLSWTVIRVHGNHTHPFLGPVTGNDIAFTGPAPEDLAAAANSYLRIALTATDKQGLATTVTRDFRPLQVPVTLATSPAGRTVTANGLPVTGPATMTSWAGYGITLGVPPQTDSAATLWGYSSWSDGGAQTHAFTTPSSQATVTATLTARPPLDRAGWTVSASGSAPGEGPGLALDGDPATRWTSGTAMAAGQWVQLDLGRSLAIRHVVLNAGAASPGDYPRGYTVSLSADGVTWGAPVATGAGTEQVTRATFATQTARYVRITETAAAPNWWSIAEVNAFS
ncbi:MAG: hypothetical protein JWO79_863 [Actinomycetia bacterium]|nr:hypothetical protein [Actinomycetes bacterium]